MSNICKYYLQGNCYKGSNCRFQHVNNDSYDTHGYRGNSNYNQGGHTNYNRNYQQQNYNNQNYNQSNQNRQRNYNQGYNQNYDRNYQQSNYQQSNRQQSNYQHSKNHSNQNNFNRNSTQTHPNYNRQNYDNQNFNQSDPRLFGAHDQQSTTPVQFSFNQKLEEINRVSAPPAADFSFTQALMNMQHNTSNNQFGQTNMQQINQMNTFNQTPADMNSSIVQQSSGGPKVPEIYSNANELSEADRCSFMAQKFDDTNRIPLLPPPKECC